MDPDLRLHIQEQMPVIGHHLPLSDRDRPFRRDVLEEPGEPCAHGAHEHWASIRGTPDDVIGAAPDDVVSVLRLSHAVVHNR